MIKIICPGLYLNLEKDRMSYEENIAAIWGVVFSFLLTKGKEHVYPD